VAFGAPSFGSEGPYARRPAYAPTIGAGAGLARRNLRSAVPEGPDLALAQVKNGAQRMGMSTLTMAHSDGFSALGVACAEMIALYAKKRGRGGQAILTTILATMAQMMSEDGLDYPGRPEIARADADLYGFGPLYRLYEAQEGWVFLAAPAAKDWAALQPRAMGSDARSARLNRRRAKPRCKSPRPAARHCR
jgi:crotonobetainyl-CoA:carnitine CoA-transferase CaiB-like acyl-CoA transferase